MVATTRAGWEAAQAARAAIFARPSNEGRPFPSRPKERFVFVSESRTPLTVSGFNSIWRYLKRAAMEAGVVDRGQHFTLHGLKHRGVTDTKGSRKRKQQASGHQTEQMVVLYDHDVPVVQPAMPPAAASEF